MLVHLIVLAYWSKVKEFYGLSRPILTLSRGANSDPETTINQSVMLKLNKSQVSATMSHHYRMPIGMINRLFSPLTAAFLA
jgi:hypothetical protein